MLIRLKFPRFDNTLISNAPETSIYLLFDEYIAMAHVVFVNKIQKTAIVRWNFVWTENSAESLVDPHSRLNQDYYGSIVIKWLHNLF